MSGSTGITVGGVYLTSGFPSSCIVDKEETASMFVARTGVGKHFPVQGRIANIPGLRATYGICHILFLFTSLRKCKSYS